MARRTILGLLIALAAILAAASGLDRPRPARRPRSVATPCTFKGRLYVDPRHGNDHDCGTDPQFAWRTVARVNRARLRPGTTVLFAGGEIARWGAGTSSLQPRSGMTYASYGSGRAVFRAAAGSPGNQQSAVFLCSARDVTLQDLRLEGGDDASDRATAIASGETPRYCSPSVGIRIEGLIIRNWFQGIQAGYRDKSWQIMQVTIDHTAGNGILFDRHDGRPNLGGEALDVFESVIRHTGEHPPAGYAVHGIYDNSADSRLIGNTIQAFSSDGISIRFHGAVVQNNVIEGGALGIGVFSLDRTGATTRLVGNTISDTIDGGIFVCGPSASCPRSPEHFVVARNSFHRVAGLVLNLAPAAGGYSLDRQTARLGR